MKFSPVSTPRENSKLQLENLEQRMMLSTVTVEAVGQEGSENMSVFVGDELVIETTVSQSGGSFSATLERDFSANDVRIEFTNDLYQPEEGFDRNLTISSFSVDGQFVDVGGQEMFSTGVWRSEDGVTSGFGRGSTLHANGYFQLESFEAQTLFFGEKEWSIDGSGAFSETFVDGSGALRLVEGAVSVSTRFDVVGGTLHALDVDAYRENVEPTTSNGQPWSTIGVNFYDANGNYLGQERIDISASQTDPSSSRAIEFVTPDASASAYVWVWLGEGPLNPLVVKDISFEEVNLSGDTTPPTLSLRPATVTEPTGEEINFAVDFADDFRLGNPAAFPFQVSGPNGFSELAGVRTGLPGSTDTFQTLIYGLLKPDGSDWSPADNGTYTVELLQGALADQAGNVTSSQIIGTINVAIVLPPTDVEAPGISIGDIPNLTEPVVGPIEFVIYTTDNRDPIPFANNVTVFRNDGYAQTVTGIAGGFDEANNRNWELYQIQPPTGGSWGPEDSGQYFVRLEDGGLIDAAGNQAEGQVLGSFFVDLVEFVA